MSQCNDFWCPNRNIITGYCTITACIKPIQSQQILVNGNKNFIMIFPQTIGDVTFYSKGELMDWVITQQKMNKDPDFGVGRYS